MVLQWISSNVLGLEFMCGSDCKHKIIQMFKVFFPLTETMKASDSQLVKSEMEALVQNFI